MTASGDLRRSGEGAAPEAVALSGASGLVGKALRSRLESSGCRVLPLVRRIARPGEISWDPEAGAIDLSALEGVDAVVHLAGENIGEGRWTPAKKERIWSSRVRGTQVLCEGLACMKRRPSVLLSASAIGWYGNGGESCVDEHSPPGKGFLPELCKAWEAATKPAAEAGVRVVNLRIGVVLSPREGALAKMLTPFRLGLGGPIGRGRQFVSWIALPDLLGVMQWCLRDASLSGPVNATAPGALRQAEFARALGRTLRRPAVSPLPAFVIRLAMGEKGEALLLEGARVSPKKLLDAGFVFQYSEIEGALRAVLSS